MTAVIFLGGTPVKIPDAAIADISGSTLVIAADSGWENAVMNGVKPDMLVGDMDSIIEIPEAGEVVRVPCEKDDTDAQLAIDIAVSRGAERIIMVGQLSGRADHTLSEIFMLESLRNRGVNGEIIDDRNRVSIIKDGETIIPRRGYKYFGILSLGRTVVSEISCRYPLDKYVLTRDNPFAVSNEIVGDAAVITAEGDALLVIESN